MSGSWRRIEFLAWLCGLALTAGCRKPAASSSRVKRYRLRGQVKNLLPSKQAAVIAHEAILGEDGQLWMEAMTMEFPVRNAQEFAKLTSNAVIEARLNQDETTFDYWLDEIRVLSGAP